MNPTEAVTKAAATSNGREYHVAITGNDHDAGTREAPLRRISAAAALAQPGDEVIVHAGTYRERVDPARGGESDTRRIVYRAADGECVQIKGSEVVKSWERVQGDVWRARVQNSLFGDFNPYATPLRGHWLTVKDRTVHPGAVYLNGHWLLEAVTLEELSKPATGDPLWFAEVGDTDTLLHAQFPGRDPNREEVEINVRQSVFYPSQPGTNYISVIGFAMCHAATPWCPPTTEQIGLLGCHWSKGWIIENNTVSYSACVGITLGKYDDPLDFPEKDVVEGTAGGDTYHGTIARALENGWNFESVGSHIVRNNVVSHCEAAGICGSMGAIGSLVTGNTIHDIHVRRLFTGAEQAGIKFHGAIDTLISQNRVFRCHRGIWLDWMSQGTRVSGNLCYDNGPETDLYLEVNHGPYVVDNNFFLSKRAVNNWSHGGAYLHNVILGTFEASSDPGGRLLPYHHAHDTRLAGWLDVKMGDDRIFNNIIAEPRGLTAFNETTLPVWLDGNVFLGEALPSRHDTHAMCEAGYDVTQIKVTDDNGKIRIHIKLDPAWKSKQPRQLVQTDRLGLNKVTQLPFVDTDGSPLIIDADYFGAPRDVSNPFPGPIEA